ncbi:GNAT family N-acetyltransferase [Flagellimonas meridianipacifica]|uniref:Acetyltransferase (GNAT) family protein n=1 Tax=Flagellimonas meridianipacifica TaxID=1080225 RepID=A0A2T0MBB3_9FLAO|nr:GNAT family N-acetyltransferase [Allomuricauda pacifica]PRX54791.1 acetyltransferase (GNAT) family protein [Allomuricauda pacifica]
MVSFKKASSDKEYEIGKTLFLKYADDIGIDLAFQDFDSELKNLEIQYGPPEGALFLIYTKETVPIGCFALRKLDSKTCELKRMFLEKTQRGKGIGKQMMDKALVEARSLGYSKIRLDSIKSMKTAIALYQAFGFKEIEAYRHNPFDDAVYFEKDL